MFGVAAPRESDVAVAGRDQGVRSSSVSPLEGDVVRGFCQTRWAALHSGEQVIGRNGVSEAEAQRATATSDSLGAATPNMAASEELADRVAVSLRHLIIGRRSSWLWVAERWSACEISGNQ